MLKGDTQRTLSRGLSRELGAGLSARGPGAWAQDCLCALGLPVLSATLTCKGHQSMVTSLVGGTGEMDP